MLRERGRNRDHQEGESCDVALHVLAGCRGLRDWGGTVPFRTGDGARTTTPSPALSARGAGACRLDDLEERRACRSEFGGLRILAHLRDHPARASAKLGVDDGDDLRFTLGQCRLGRRERGARSADALRSPRPEA